MRTNHASHSQSISNIEKMIGQLASTVQNLVTNIEKGKFPSQPLPNPKGVHEVGTKSEIHHEEVKSVTTLRSGRVIDNMVGTPERKYLHPHQRPSKVKRYLPTARRLQKIHLPNTMMTLVLHLTFQKLHFLKDWAKSTKLLHQVRLWKSLNE